VARGQVAQLCAFQTTSRVAKDLVGRGARAQAGFFDASSELAILAIRPFTVDEERRLSSKESCLSGGMSSISRSASIGGTAKPNYSNRRHTAPRVTAE
jgi:hypothetical protein